MEATGEGEDAAALRVAGGMLADRSFEFEVAAGRAPTASGDRLRVQCEDATAGLRHCRTGKRERAGQASLQEDSHWQPGVPHLATFSVPIVLFR